jgi:general secretion pathway protein G
MTAVRGLHSDPPGSPRSRTASRGFTLIELMVVMAIILILATLGAGKYYQTVIRAREAALKTDLTEMRKAIQNYTIDKEQGPTSLDDLVNAGYLRQVPNDPVSGSKDWVTETNDTLYDPDQTTPGITDVHSGSDAISPFENTPYSSW